MASGVEKVVLLERDQPNTIPWEVLTDLGELRMGLDGVDGGTVVKPTVWLTYGYVVDGVDPESGSDPQPPTPSWEQQMVEQATQANQAAQAAQKAAEEAAESVASAGPYAEEAKKSAEAAKASQEAAATSAQQASQAAKDAQAAAGSIGNAVEQAQSAATAADVAKRAAETAQTAAAQSAGTAQGAATTASQAAKTAQGAATQAGQYLASVEADAQVAADAATAAGKSQEAAQGAAQAAASARDQATTAATTAQDHATAARTAKDAAEQAAGNVASAKAEAAQSAQDAAGSASAAQQAKEAAEAAASILPATTPEDAGKGLRVNADGTGYEFGSIGSEELLLAEYIHRGNQEIHFASFDWETGIGECTVPHGLKGSKQVLIAGSASFEQQLNLSKVPIEWSKYNDAIWVVPVDETRVRVAGGEKLDQIPVNAESPDNSNININSIWLEIPVRFAINGLSEIKPIIATRMTISGYVMGIKNQYMYVGVNSDAGKLESFTLGPGPIPSTLGAYHGCYCFSDFYLEASNNENHIVFVHSLNGFLGRKPGSSTETSKASSNHVDFLGFQGQVNSIDSFRDYYGVYSNGTIVRIYALGVKQE